jgi:hypothetical protein
MASRLLSPLFNDTCCHYAAPLVVAAAAMLCRFIITAPTSSPNSANTLFNTINTHQRGTNITAHH